MSDPDSDSTFYDQHFQALRKANELNKNVVFDALVALGITSVTVEFDGYSDSGQIEEITAQASGGDTELPSTSLTTFTPEETTCDVDAVETTLRDAIEALCYDYLNQEHSGWENSDGAYGEFRFDVGARSIHLEFNARFMDATNYTHDF